MTYINLVFVKSLILFHLIQSEVQVNILNPLLSSLKFKSLCFLVTGGLYDNAMGPSARGDICTTCLNDENNCNGHFGHIDLIMPCYNPLFMKYAVIILRSSCIKCMKLQVSARMKEIVALQLRLIDAGFVTEAQDLEDRKFTFCNSSKNSRKKQLDDDDSQDDRVEKSYNKHIKRLNKLLSNNEGKERSSTTKTSEALRLAIVHSCVVEATVGGYSKSKCMHCQLPLRRVRISNKKIVVMVGKNDMIQAQQLLEKEDRISDVSQKSNLKTIVANEARELLKVFIFFIFTNEIFYIKLHF